MNAHMIVLIRRMPGHYSTPGGRFSVIRRSGSKGYVVFDRNVTLEEMGRRGIVAQGRKSLAACCAAIAYYLTNREGVTT